MEAIAAGHICLDIIPDLSAQTPSYPSILNNSKKKRSSREMITKLKNWFTKRDPQLFEKKMFSSNEDVFQFISQLIETLQKDNQLEWSHAFDHALRSGTLSGEIFGNIRICLMRFCRTDLPKNIIFLMKSMSYYLA